MDNIIMEGGKPYRLTEYTMDFGKAGTAHVRVLDPCISQEAQQRRREAIVRKCQEIAAREGF